MSADGAPAPRVPVLLLACGPCRARITSGRKQQVLGLTNTVRDAWEARGGTAVAVAKDLGISHYGYGTNHPELGRKVESLRASAQRICSTGGTQTGRCNIMTAVLFGKCLCGSEYHYITERQIVSMRRAKCAAMGDKEGRRLDSVSMGWHESSRSQCVAAPRSPSARVRPARDGWPVAALGTRVALVSVIVTNLQIYRQAWTSQGVVRGDL